MTNFSISGAIIGAVFTSVGTALVLEAGKFDPDHLTKAQVLIAVTAISAAFLGGSIGSTAKKSNNVLALLAGVRHRSAAAGAPRNRTRRPAAVISGTGHNRTFALS